jgi:hypothetical protein
MKKRAIKIIHNLLMESNEDFSEEELIFFYVKRIAIMFGLGGILIGWVVAWFLQLAILG